MSDGLQTELGLDLGQLRQAIQEEYTAVARDPGRGYHFHTGRPLASMLVYDEGWLEGLPAGSIASFAGTGNPFRIGLLRPGERIVDVGSGAGIDSLLAAKMVGPDGHVIGVDIGLDLGLSSFVVTSDGEDIPNPKYYRRDEQKLARLQRRHARKKKGSKTREKARRKVDRWHARIADQRRDSQHKLSTRITLGTKWCASKRWRSRTCSRTRTCPSPSRMWVGASSCGNWTTRRSGTGACWSRSTSGSRPVKRAMCASMSFLTLTSPCGSGSVPTVEPRISVTTTRQKMFWRLD